VGNAGSGWGPNGGRCVGNPGAQLGGDCDGREVLESILLALKALARSLIF